MNKQLLILRSLNFFYYASSAAVNPFLPVFFADRGYDSLQIGLLMMIGSFAAMFAQPFWGYVSDKFNSVKRVIFLLWVLTLLSSVGLFHTTGYSWSLLFALLYYFFLIPSIPLLDSLTIQGAQLSGKSYGSIRMWGSVGYTVLAILAGYALALVGGIGNMYMLYWIIMSFPLLLLLFLKDSPGGGPKIELSSLKTVLFNKPLLLFLLIIFLMMVPHRMNDGLFGLHAASLGASNEMIGWAWALAALSEVPVFALLGRYVHKFHELALLGIVGLLYTVRWIGYGMAEDPFVLMYLQASNSITFAVFWLVSVHYVLRIVPEQFRSTGQSLLAAVFLGLAGISGSTAGGWIRGVWGGSAMYYAGAVLAFISALLLFAYHARLRRGRAAVYEKDAVNE